MMRLGVRAHDFGKLPLEELAARIAAAGFSCVQFALTKAVAGFDADAGRLSPGLANYIRSALQQKGIQIAVIGCYINLGDPDRARRQPQMERFKGYLRHARDFGCSVVGTETGSINADYSFHPDNHGEEAYQTVLAGVRELVLEAEKFGVFVCIEGVERYVISSPQRMRRLLDDVNSPNLQVIFDPVNLLSLANYQRQEEIIRESLALFGERIAILHAKDFVVEDGRFKPVRFGLGQLKHELVLKLIKAQKPGIDILMEDTDPKTVGEGARFLRELYGRV